MIDAATVSVRDGEHVRRYASLDEALGAVHGDYERLCDRDRDHERASSRERIRVGRMLADLKAEYVRRRGNDRGWRELLTAHQFHYKKAQRAIRLALAYDAAPPDAREAILGASVRATEIAAGVLRPSTRPEPAHSGTQCVPDSGSTPNARPVDDGGFGSLDVPEEDRVLGEGPWVPESEAGGSCYTEDDGEAFDDGEDGYGEGDDDGRVGTESFEFPSGGPRAMPSGAATVAAVAGAGPRADHPPAAAVGWGGARAAAGGREAVQLTLDAEYDAAAERVRARLADALERGVSAERVRRAVEAFERELAGAAGD